MRETIQSERTSAPEVPGRACHSVRVVQPQRGGIFVEPEPRGVQAPEERHHRAHSAPTRLGFYFGQDFSTKIPLLWSWHLPHEARAGVRTRINTFRLVARHDKALAGEQPTEDRKTKQQEKENYGK